VRLYFGGGTTNEVFEEYFSELVYRIDKAYANKELLIIMDNLRAHKNPCILKIMQHFPRISILYTPAHTPM
jgi:hypothetical protein